MRSILLGLLVAGCDGMTSYPDVDNRQRVVDTGEPADTDTDTDTMPEDTGEPEDSGLPQDTGEPVDTDTGEPPEPEPEPEVSCLSGASMSWSPSPPNVFTDTRIAPSANVGYVYVGLRATFPDDGTVREGSWVGVSGGGPYTWEWDVHLDRVGVWTLEFTADDGATTVCTAHLPVGA